MGWAVLRLVLMVLALALSAGGAYAQIASEKPVAVRPSPADAERSPKPEKLLGDVTTKDLVPVLAVAIPLIGSLISQAAGYATGAGRMAADRRRLEMHKLQLEVLEQIGKIRGASPSALDLDSALLRVLASVEETLPEKDQDQSKSVDFPTIDELPIYKKYFVLPKPRTIGSTVVSGFYYIYLLYVPVILVAMFDKSLATELDVGGDWRSTLFYGVVAAGLAASLRMWAFSLRRSHDRKAAARQAAQAGPARDAQPVAVDPARA